jgi:phthalate 4,5-dioxygenase reductase subunit
MPTDTQSLRVSVAEPAAQGIARLQLRHPQGLPLPPFTAGAHITVKTPSGAWRQYSLSNHPDETDCYEIAVKREGRGRGGSLSLVDGVRAGDLIEVGLPQNQFELDERASRVLLIAGGIFISHVL